MRPRNAAVFPEHRCARTVPAGEPRAAASGAAAGCCSAPAQCSGTQSRGGWRVALSGRGERHEEVAADAVAEIVHALEEIHEPGVQALLEDGVDAAVVQVGLQEAGAPLRSEER